MCLIAVYWLDFFLCIFWVGKHAVIAWAKTFYKYFVANFVTCLVNNPFSAIKLSCVLLWVWEQAGSLLGVCVGMFVVVEKEKEWADLGMLGGSSAGFL